jgi:predicted ATPase
MVWEDLHWADPSTLELLGRFTSQVASARVLVVSTFRPGFQHIWGTNTHFSQLVLPRLTPLQVEAMLSGILTGQAVPAELVAHVMTTTDGVPLFIEELTKMLLETGRLRQTATGYVLTDRLPLHAIPVTLYDTLLARLERLTPGAEVARVAAVLGREFSATVLQAVAPLAAETVQQGLLQLVEADLVMPQGRYPARWYRFKHTLMQQAAYQSVLWRTRQQYHQHIAQVLESRFPELVSTQPELLAHHYTDAGCPAQAVVYWLRAGQYAIERSAALEAIAHLHQGLEVLTALPDTRERWQHELDLQIALGTALMATRGWADPELAHAYTRARQLCQAMDNLPQHFWALQGLWNFYAGRGELHTTQTLAEHMLALAQRTADPTMLSLAHHSLGITCHYLGRPVSARGHLDQGMALHDPVQHRAPTRLQDEQHWHIAGRSYMVYLLWALGFPDQARDMLHHTLQQAMAWAYPSNMAFVFTFATILHQLCRELQATSTRAEALIALATEQGFPHWGAMGLALRG